MGPLLVGLDAAHYEAHRNGYSIHLNALYQTEELPHLIHVSTARFLRPAPLVLRNVVDITADGRMTLLCVEPPSIPPLQRGVQRHSNVLTCHFIMELQIHTADHSRTAPALLLQPEQVSKEVEVGQNAKIRLVEVDKDSNMQDNIWMQIA